MNQELKRRSRVVRIFPNRESCRRLAAALVKEWHEDWITGRRYLRMEPREPGQAEQDGSEELLVTAAWSDAAVVPAALGPAYPG